MVANRISVDKHRNGCSIVIIDDRNLVLIKWSEISCALNLDFRIPDG